MSASRHLDPHALVQVELLPPQHLQVVLINDDFTPMDFVIGVLMRFFNKNMDEAYQIMMKVHVEGRGVCGIYPPDIAKSKAQAVIELARKEQHPLLCLTEPIAY